MRWADLRHVFARSDVRTGAIVGGVLGFSVLVIALHFYTYSCMELLEEADRWYAYAQQMALHEFREGGERPEALEAAFSRLPVPNGSLRVVDREGRVVARLGDWPPEEREIAVRTYGPSDPGRGLLSVHLLRKRNWLVGAQPTGSGNTLELALPLRHFASEASEQLRLFATAGIVAASIVLLIGLGAVQLAFSPLRRGTRLLRDADGGTRGLRLPTRATGDPIDRHAETLNRVLERIDAAFLRLRGFSSNAAHELRTPLNRIRNVSEVALLRGGEADLRAALEAVQATSEELSDVVQSLLLLAELDDRRVQLRPEKIEVGSWVAHHLDAFGPPFESAGVKLVSDVEPLVIRGDRTLLDRILANLLDNALAHAPEGSRVEIRVRGEGEGMSLCVDDAGPGIPQAERERIFDRFARAGGRGSGHGLGLALARAIAEVHGGRLRAGASSSGGARLELWLPAAERPRS